MEVEERAWGARGGRAAEALWPAEGVLEASKPAPLEVKEEKGRDATAQRSVYSVHHLPSLSRHFFSTWLPLILFNHIVSDFWDGFPSCFSARLCSATDRRLETTTVFTISMPLFIKRKNEAP